MTGRRDARHGGCSVAARATGITRRVSPLGPAVRFASFVEKTRGHTMLGASMTAGARDGEGHARSRVVRSSTVAEHTSLVDDEHVFANAPGDHVSRRERATVKAMRVVASCGRARSPSTRASSTTNTSSRMRPAGSRGVASTRASRSRVDATPAEAPESFVGARQAFDDGQTRRAPRHLLGLHVNDARCPAETRRSPRRLLGCGASQRHHASGLSPRTCRALRGVRRGGRGPHDARCHAPGCVVRSSTVAEHTSLVDDEHVFANAPVDHVSRRERATVKAMRVVASCGRARSPSTRASSMTNTSSRMRPAGSRGVASTRALRSCTDATPVEAAGSVAARDTDSINGRRDDGRRAPGRVQRRGVRVGAQRITTTRPVPRMPTTRCPATISMPIGRSVGSVGSRSSSVRV